MSGALNLIGGTATEVFEPLSVVADPAAFTWYNPGETFWISTLTGSTPDGSIATASGGSGSYSYLWEALSLGGAVSAVGPDCLFFNYLSNTPSVFRCLLTDTVTLAQAYSNNVSVDP